MDKQALNSRISFDALTAVASHAERAAGRKLSRQETIPEQEGLRRILRAAAGADDLIILMKNRIASRRQQAERQAAHRQQKLALRAAKLAKKRAPPGAWQAWFDGSARPNPGTCRIACVLRGPDGEHFTHGENIDYGDSSAAEYRALIAALQLALDRGADTLHIRGDSRVVIDDVLHQEHTASPILHAYRRQALTLMAQFGAIDLRWIPRHKNTEADALTRL